MGCCLENEEKLLAWEFITKTILEKFLFGSLSSAFLVIAHVLLP